MGTAYRRRKAMAKSMARLLAEEYGSVDGFMDENNVGLEPGSPQESMYRQLRQGQEENDAELERKLGGLDGKR